MNNLQYKGFKSTRFVSSVAIAMTGTLFFITGGLSEEGWIDLIKWTFGTYAMSEGVAKSAEAHKNRGINDV